MPDLSQRSPVTQELVLVAAVSESLATVVVLLRFYLRISFKQGLKWDDWLALLSLVFSWAYAICIFVAGAEVGVDWVKVDPLSAAKGFVEAAAIGTLLLTFVIVPVKMSVLLFYKRLFGQTSPSFTLSVWIAMGVVTAWGIVLFVAQLLIGDPDLKSLWEDIEHPKYRFDYFKFGTSIPIISVILDGIILLFPIPVLKNLQLPLKKKICAYLMFSLGSFCIVTGAIRTHFWFKNAELVTNPNIVNVDKWQYETQVQIWVFLEMTASIICACLPVMGPLLTRSLYAHISGRFSGLSYKLRFSRNTTGKSSGTHGTTSRSFQRFGSTEQLPISTGTHNDGRAWSESGSQRTSPEDDMGDIELADRQRQRTKV